MNINDFKLEDLKLGPGDKLDKIFERQLELMKKYHEIEKKNGFLICEDVPVNLNDSKGQFRLKDFAWRITEELGEALEAFHKHPKIKEHYNEEIADAMHFLVEFTILSGITVDWFQLGGQDKLDDLFNATWAATSRQYFSLCRDVGIVVENLAMTCNCLKNKPWKNTQMMTDVEYFILQVKSTWYAFAQLCQRSGLNSDRMFDLYFRKSEVNKFRQRSNY